GRRPRRRRRLSRFRRFRLCRNSVRIASGGRQGRPRFRLPRAGPSLETGMNRKPMSPLDLSRCGNRMIEAMDAEDLARLAPDMRLMTVEKDQVLIEQDQPVTEVHFPIATELANLMTFRDGSAVEVSRVGSEGVSGLVAFMASAPCAWSVQVQSGDTVLCLPSASLRRAVTDSPRLMRRLVLLTHDNQSQTSQNAACNALHDT